MILQSVSWVFNIINIIPSESSTDEIKVTQSFSEVHHNKRCSCVQTIFTLDSLNLSFWHIWQKSISSMCQNLSEEENDQCLQTFSRFSGLELTLLCYWGQCWSELFMSFTNITHHHNNSSGLSFILFGRMRTEYMYILLYSCTSVMMRLSGYGNVSKFYFFVLYTDFVGNTNVKYLSCQ